jgi:predicted sulfurtransferase
MGRILLYYKYVEIEYPGAVAKWHLKRCKELGLTGRVIIAHEGINGTLGGSIENTQIYIDELTADSRFQGIDFKEAQGDATCFPRLRVVVKDEIVKLGLDTTKVTVKDTATHLTPEKFHAILNENPEDIILIDTRNDYESRVGHFRNSLIPNTKNFRDFPEFVEQQKNTLKDKRVLMYCTGGVRCERASAFVKQATEAKEVYQLEGGIHRYIEKYPDGHFRGSNYVFDARVTARANNDILGTCDICAQPWDQYVNCTNAFCNKHFICCPDCILKYEESCGVECYTKLKNNEVKRRPKPFRSYTPIAQQL